jgi:hypothetical protein
VNDPSGRPGLPPEQQDTARLLSELLGKAIAARYEDFCRLSMGLFDLNVSKPMAAHALRELDSVLRGVLAVPMDAVAVVGRETKEKLEAAERALKDLGYDDASVGRALDGLVPRTKHKDQIRRILTRLGFEPNGDIAQLWFRIVDNYQIAHGRSFHRPLVVDEDFITRLQQPFDVVIRSVITALRGHYAALMRRVEALVAMPDRGHAVKLFAHEIPGAPQLQWHFFNNLTIGSWLDPLMREGLLSEPARFTEDEGEGRLYGEWPAGEYLRRMAGSDDIATRQRVVTALHALSGADHPEVLSRGIAIIAALPPAEAAPLVEIGTNWLGRDGHTQYGQAPIDLIRRLAEAGQGKAALKVAREVFRLWGADGKTESHFSDQMYEYQLPLLRKTLTMACGCDALAMLIDLLRQVIDIEGKSGYSRSYMHSVAHVNNPPFDIEDALVTAVRETAEDLVRDRACPMIEVIGLLAANDAKIFARLALYIMAQDPASAPELATAYLLNEDLITGDWCNPDYAALATAWFPSLFADEQEAILRVVDGVPDIYLESWAAGFEERQKVPPSANDVERFRFNCVRNLV